MVGVESIGQIDHIIREGVRALVSGLRKGQQRPSAVRLNWRQEERVMNNESDASTESAVGIPAKWIVKGGINNPELSEFQCLMFGSTRTNGLVWRPLKGGEPNWFWRKMQYLILGSKWVKDPKEKSK